MHKLSHNQIVAVVEKGSRALFEYCFKNSIHYLVTGSSGGLDSAVTLGFAQRACQLAKEVGFQLTSVGIIMPCESTQKSEVLGRKAIKQFSAEELYIDLTPNYYNLHLDIIDTNRKIHDLLENTGGKDALAEWDYSLKIAQGNIKARLRMMLGTYHTARMMKGMVMSTDNLSEFWMAFWTICGDVGDFGIIQQVLKGLELYDIAWYLGVPEEIITAKPDDGLGIATGDEDQLGASYPVLDKVIIYLIQHGFDPDGSFDQLDSLPEVPDVDSEVVIKLARRCLAGSFKRKGTIVLTREELGLPQIEEIKLSYN